MIAHKATATGITCRGLRTALPSRPAAAAAPSKRSIAVRYREEDRQPFDLENIEEQLEQVRSRPAGSPTQTKLSQQQLEEVYRKEPGNVSPRMAEIRADLGTAATDINQLQTFDGPAPETINGRLAMLGVATGLLFEITTGQGLLQQTADHPIFVFASFVLISIATYIPLIKGYTRKEAFATSLWSPKAENWNGRLAMMGFTGMILTEAISGVNTLQAWGLQAVPVPGIHY
jgi:hypothetical protein